MRRARSVALAALLLLPIAACSAAADADRAPRSTIFIGIDVGDSFREVGSYDDALAFAAHYIVAHLRGLGGLEVPQALFVGAIGSGPPGRPLAFRAMDEFRGRAAAEIEADLRRWFPPVTRPTDFNVFFRRVAALARRENLVLGPITLVLLSNGVPAPDPGHPPTGPSAERYGGIDIDPLEYLSRNVTIRLLYPEPSVAVRWEDHVTRSRVRLWTVDRVIMAGWRAQLQPAAALDAQADFLRWVQDIVDFQLQRRAS